MIEQTPRRASVLRRASWVAVLVLGVVAYVVVLNVMVSTRNLNFFPSLLLLGAVTVPMTISLNNRALGTTAIEYKAADLFTGAGSTPGASISMPLTIAQTTPAPIATKGRYAGIVSVVLNQKATTP